MSDDVGKVDAHLRSILIQVAFKGAIELATAGKVEVSALVPTMDGLYDRLIEKHTALQAGELPRSYGGNRGGGGGNFPKTEKKWEGTFEVVKIDYFGNGTPIEFQDRRPAKVAGKYSPKAADFQSVNKFDLGDGKGEQNIPIWLKNQDGSDNADSIAMVAKAIAPAAQSVSAQNTAPF